MIWTETPFTLNSGVMQQGDLERFPMANRSPTLTPTRDTSGEKSQSMHQTPFALNNSANCNGDIFEPFPIMVTSHQDDSRPRVPSFHSFITLASSKLDSLPEIEDDAILFDRLAEVCNLSSNTSSAKRLSPIQPMSVSEERPRKKQRHVDCSDSEDETSPRFR